MPQPVRATVTWKEGLLFEGVGEDSPSSVLIHVPEEGEKRRALGPLYLFLLGVASCTAVDMVVILGKMREQVSGLTVNVAGRQREKRPRRFEKVSLEYVVRGKSIKPANVERAISLSHEKYCSATATLADFVQLSHSYQIEEG